MRIDVVVPSAFPAIGGMETRVHEIGKHLVRSGHQVIVHAAATALPSGSETPVAQLEGIEIRRYRPLIRRHYFTTVFVPDGLEGDVVDFQGYPHPTGDLVARRLRSRPYVVTPYGLLYRHPGFARALRHLYDRHLGSRTLRGAARVMLMTEAEIPEALRLGVRREALRIVAGGVGDEAFEPTAPLEGRALGRFDRYILFLGRLHHDKSPLELVRAFAVLAAEMPDLGLVFAGPDGGEGARVCAAFSEPRLRERAVWLGAVSTLDKRRLLAGCALLCLPSRFEALGVVLLEAWAQGKPVLASRLEGVEVVVHDTGGGLLHEPGDHESLVSGLRTLLQDPERAAALGSRGRDAVHASYRWCHLADRAAQVLAEAAGA